MSKEKKPLFSDEFLEELANEINEEYGKPKNSQDESPYKKEKINDHDYQNYPE